MVETKEPTNVKPQMKIHSESLEETIHVLFCEKEKKIQFFMNQWF